MITVKIDMPDLSERYEKRAGQAQFLLDSQIIEDTSPYVPWRTGELDKSALRSSTIGGGLIVYDTPYARHMYYGVHYRTGKKFNYNKTMHPLASEQWFEQAKSAYLEKWQKKVKEILQSDN